MRKGQTVNIDWTVGLGLFLITALTAVVFLVNADFGPDPITSLEAKNLEVQRNLEEETSVSGRKLPLISKGPVNVSKIPVDRYYEFPSETLNKSGGGNIPAELEIYDNNIVAVTDGGNVTNYLVYFSDPVSDASYNSDLEASTEWINNSKIAVRPDSSGINSLKIKGQELLNPDADLGTGDSSINKSNLYAETLSTNLRVYSNSSELILSERSENVTFNLDNLNTLYWYENDTNIPLDGTGLKAEGSTQGFTVASGHGITFVGDMDATVNKPDSSTVRAEIDAEELRIRLHDSGYEAGKKRIKFYDKGDIFLGISEKFSASYKSKIIKLKNLTENEFENRLNIGNFGYNISFGKENKNHYLEKGEKVPIDTSTVVADRSFALVNRNGTFSDIQNRVILWR